MAAARGPGEGAAAAGGGGSPQDGRQSRLLRGGCGRHRGVDGANKGRAPQHPAASGRGCPGSRRTPLSSPSICIEAPGSRSHPLPGLPRQVTAAEPGRGRLRDTPLNGVSSERGGRSSPRPPRPSLPRARFPRRSSFPRRRCCPGLAPERGAFPGSRRALGRPRSRRINGSGLPRILPRAVPWSACGLGLAAHPSRKGRPGAGNVLGTFCPQLLGRPCRPPLCAPPRAGPAPYKRASGCSVPGRRGSARRLRAAVGVGALAERPAPGPAPSPTPGPAALGGAARTVRWGGARASGASANTVSSSLAWEIRNSRTEFNTVSSLCVQKVQSHMHLGGVKGNISYQLT